MPDMRRQSSLVVARSRLALTGVHVDLLVAVTAVDCTAPLELALALGCAADARRVVATATAHHFAAIYTSGCPVADPPTCPRRPWRESK